MSDTKIVPFGKYKGQPIEALAQDRDYCEWLTGQEWFRTKYIGIHTIIINHFGEPTQTPEHNALQAKFLDPTWCQRFALCAQIDDGLRYHVKRAAQRLTELHTAVAWDAQTRARGVALVTPLLDRLRTTAWTFNAEIEFEFRGADVQLEVSLDPEDGFSRDESRGVEIAYDRRYLIECKPMVGDDYPAILRQMRRVEAKYLVAGEVRCILPIDQLKVYFAQSSITLFLVDEIAAKPLRWDTFE